MIVGLYMNKEQRVQDNNVAIGLWFCSGLFILRVLGQLLAYQFEIPLLPSFDVWHSGAIGYQFLLGSQIIIIVMMIVFAYRFDKGLVIRHRKVGDALQIIGILYFSIMFARLSIYLGGLSGHVWFNRPIPSFFHLVLACYIFLAGSYHLNVAEKKSNPIDQVLNQHILPWIAYPGVMILSLFLQSMMLDRNMGVLASSYLPITLGVFYITLLELKIPYRNEWRPKIAEVKTDLLFTVLIQMILPKLLAFLVAISLLAYLQTHDLVMSGLWPDQWPMFMQVILMLVSAEFLRYWVHRLAHVWSPLWRLHAVHHSPDKLYWLNTSRFHPLEKGIQFLFDALPFILLGVSEVVLSVYFVFYAINGFFQHSNINLRLGVLNYVISSAQLHRWHHSKDIGKSGTNFGNNLIIWDLLFGSRYLPKGLQVGELGLINQSYPMSFFSQLKTPFTPGIDKHSTKILGIHDVLVNFKIQLGALLTKLLIRTPFQRSLSKPMKYQHKLLMNIMRENKNTEFGKQHNFDKVKTPRQFINQVSIQDYEDLRPLIEQQELTKKPWLTATQPTYYAITSGTTGKPKHIPVFKKIMTQHQRALILFYSGLRKINRQVFSGKQLVISGAYQEGTLAGGSIYGSISGFFYYLLPHYLREKYVVSNDVFTLHDYELKYRLLIRLAIQHSDVSYMVTANPSTFLKLIEIINAEIETFADDIQTGSFNGFDKLPKELANSVKKQLISDTKRADELKRLKSLGREISYADIWPNLKIVATWKGGSCGAAITRLKKLLSPDTQIIELGYLSSEFRGTITLEDTGDSGVPTFHDNFFEFIEIKQYEQGVRETLMLDQLSSGQQYFVIITTAAGLYRYFMNDIIEVTGYRKNTPLIRFVQKGKGVTNITGEKLSEQQLMTAVEELNAELNLDMSFYLALTSIKNSRYDLYVEAEVDTVKYAALLDDKLQQLNTEYAAKRSSGRLRKMMVKPVATGTGNAYKEHGIAKGLRESQFKYLLLQNEMDCDFPFKDYML